MSGSGRYHGPRPQDQTLRLFEGHLLMHQERDRDGRRAPAPRGAVQVEKGVRNLVRFGFQPCHEIVQLTESRGIPFDDRETPPADAKGVHFVRVVAVLVPEVDDVGNPLETQPAVAGTIQRGPDLQPRRNLTRTERIASEDRTQWGQVHLTPVAATGRSARTSEDTERQPQGAGARLRHRR